MTDHLLTDLLGTLIANPVRAADVPTDAIPALLAQVAAEQARLSALETALAARLAQAAPTNGPHQDQLLTIEEAAPKLGTTRDWLRRHPDLPFVVRFSPGQVRYSAKGIERFIAMRMRPRG